MLYKLYSSNNLDINIKSNDNILVPKKPKWNRIKENRTTIANYESFNDNEFKYFSSEQINNIITVLDKKISIIVPIFNAYDDVKKCLSELI